MSHRKFHATVLVLAGALLLPACGTSGNPPQQGAALPQEAAPAAVSAPASPAPVASADASQPAAAGLREFRDPVTGQLREPTAAELRAMAPVRAASAPNAAAAPNPKEIVLPNGMVAVAPNLMSEMKGCVQPDGSVVADHDCKEQAAAPVKKP